MAFFTEYRGRNNDRGPSGEIWADLDAVLLGARPDKGVHYFDDFYNLSQHVSDQDTQQYGSYIDTGVLIKALNELDADALVPLGVCRVSGNDADNDEGVLATHGVQANVSSTASKKHPLWFEGRFRKSDVTDNGIGMFLGLAFDDGSGTVAPITNTLALTDDGLELGAFSFLGFHIAADDGNAIQFTYKAEGQTAVVISANLQAVVADTWYKVGFKYSPQYPASKRIKIYINGVEQSSYVTETQIAAATFPDDEPLGLTFVSKVGTGSLTVTHDLDWWRVAQLHD